MGKKTAISPSLGVNLVVTALAHRDSVGDISSQFGVIGKAFDVMRDKSVRVAAPLANFITGKHIISPPFVGGAVSLSSALGKLPILKRRAVFSAQCPLASDGADSLASLQRVLFAGPVRRSGFGGSAHLSSRFIAHLVPFVHAVIL